LSSDETSTVMPSGREYSIVLGFLLICTLLPQQLEAGAREVVPIYLDQGWTEEERQEFYHLSPGTQLVPYDWFLWLRTKTKTNEQRFKDMVEVFWLLPDPHAASNADRLPVGFGQTPGVSPQGPQVGVTCAFCHTGQIRYGHHRIRIDGAPSMQYNARFVQALLESLGATFKDDRKFEDFAKLVLGKEGGADRDKRAALRGQGVRYVATMVTRSSQDPSPLGWGFGRFDALGRGGNLVFCQLDPDNLRPANAPVSVPALWSSWEYDWVQWNGAIQHPLARNIAQVIGVNANLFTDPGDSFTPSVDLADPFRSSVDITALLRLEELVRKLKPPRWPKEFPSIDTRLAARGKELYHGDEAKGLKNLCAHCHVAESLPQPNAHGQRLRVHMIPQREVGTDATHAANFSARTANTKALGQDRLYAKEAIKLITDGIMKREGVPLDGENTWNAKLEYIARPHTGLWATPPYLHNGSVPNVYELLSPWENRHDCFYLDPSLEYDPKRLGFVVRECDGRSNPNDLTGGFEFKTARAGNSNRGHEFRNTPRCASEEKEPGILGCEITHENRMAIVEYLKTL
jgi:processive rubber oxygenase RoxA-like protein